MANSTSPDILNFCFPLDLSRLENDQLRLVPFDLSFQPLAEAYVKQTSETPEIFENYPCGPFESVDAYERWYIERVRAPASVIVFAIALKAGVVRKRQPGSDEVEELQVEEGTLAGTTGILNASTENAAAEIGHVVILPRFQRTFVGTTAHALLLNYLLNPRPEGLHLRRVQWQAFSENHSSIAAAQRLGFQFEGIVRWQRVLPEGKKGVSTGGMDDKIPNTDPTGRVRLGPGCHSAVLSLCWDDWENGGRERLNGLTRRYAS
ncbi:GNAT family N-acetyltransferase [Aspergillus clavatus NRRL 1]|uniref:GNAT family acetyltransferase, putative n=1 Tax=Aspergillus clavatus (strain ATCC 1007 / CBS 513.65 / DSM 816 / NCTC 3887 / NRRL 1 / QM 1276 / 107) TaxID=344612 RepID=A1CFP5_ASPCL|nr:GNAT family acetyltransferase, putative [Aspergillus clavatus NRRL 1]EAW11694.1 GNAT family acetyltransferase, putative [Aspergillus clavatus NRRL 1]